MSSNRFNGFASQTRRACEKLWTCLTLTDLALDRLEESRVLSGILRSPLFSRGSQKPSTMGYVAVSSQAWYVGSSWVMVWAVVWVAMLNGLGCSSEEASSFEGNGGGGSGETDTHGFILTDGEGHGGDGGAFGWKPFDAHDRDGMVSGDAAKGDPDNEVLDGADTLELRDADWINSGSSDGTNLGQDVGGGDGGNSGSPDTGSTDIVDMDGIGDSLNDSVMLDTGGNVPLCGNHIIDEGEDCESDILGFTSPECCTPDCQFAPLGVACAAGIAEPVCNPDFCDGMGGCMDAPEQPDGTLCPSTTGGDTCCNGQCTLGSPFVGECDSCVLPPLPQRNIFITESQSINPLHKMDEIWQHVVLKWGHSVTQGSVVDLEQEQTLFGVDILIIASPHIDLTPAAYSHVLNYLQSGGAVYVQSEFKCNYPGNMLFNNLVNATGGFFKWEYSMGGDFVGTKILECYGTYPELAPELSYFWSGCSVVDWSADTTPIAWYPPWHNLGFAYCSKSGTKPGMLITMSDKDWILFSETKNILYAHPLMRNIIARLSFPELCK